MKLEQQHHIRNAVLCLKRALQIQDWELVEAQVQRIDRVMRPDFDNYELLSKLFYDILEAMTRIEQKLDLILESSSHERSP